MVFVSGRYKLWGGGYLSGLGSGVGWVSGNDCLCIRYLIEGRLVVAGLLAGLEVSFIICFWCTD